MIRTVAFAFALAACGSKQPPPPPPARVPLAATPDQAAHDDVQGGEPAMPPELAKFHDVLAPRWHAEHGPQRMKDTCAALPDLRAGADAVAKSTPPRSANADTWTVGTKQLVAAIGGLERPCTANDAPSFEAAFAKVHESFHGLLAASGTAHEEPGHHEM